ncbi:MAG: elongation factor G, partial [Terracidiphilus sp.]
MNAHQVTSILSVAIAVGDNDDRGRVEQEIARTLAQNPSIRVRLERCEGQLVLGGQDELELEAITKKILETAAVEVGELRVAFRETIRKVAEAEGKYIRQTGGSGNYGHCWLRIEPNEPGKGYEFIN